MRPGQMKLLKEIQKVGKEKLFLDGARVCVKLKKEDISDLTIALLPTHGPFQDVLVRFNLVFKSYQREKPTVKCLTKIFHPNISSSGSVCYSLFSEHYSNYLCLMDFINGLVYFLLEPNHGDALNSSCVIRDKERFKKAVQKAASGELGDTYDQCKVHVDIEDSQSLSRYLDILLVFGDRNTFIKIMSKKLESFSKTVSLHHKNNKKICDEAFKLFKKSEKCLHEIINEARTIVGVEKFDKFDPKKISLIEKKFSDVIGLLNEFSDLERKYSQLLKDLTKRFESGFEYRLKPHVKRHIERVRISFEKPLSQFRQAMDVQISRISNLNNMDLDVEKSKKAISTLKGFLEDCKTVIDQEMSTFSYMCRVYDRFRNKNKSAEFFEKFEKNEFVILSEFSSHLHEKLSLFEEYSDERIRRRRKELAEHFKLLSDIRDVNCDRILKIEYEYHLLCEKMNSNKYEFRDVFFAYTNQGVCSLKFSGRRYVLQKYHYCGQCGVSVCVVCASKCHHKHHPLSGDRRGRFRCDCAKKGKKCVLEDKEFDEGELQFLKKKKKRFEESKDVVDGLLDKLHSLVKGESQKITDLEKKIEKSFKC